MSEVRTPTFGAIIIGDEILSGKRTDKHFTWLAGVMAADSSASARAR